MKRFLLVLLLIPALLHAQSDKYMAGAVPEVDGKVVGSCNHGFMVLLGVTESDTPAEAVQLAQKTAALRVFCDENDKMNL